MASEDEDVDLQALRNAVLATLKSSPVRSKDEDDLEVLRRAALSSKKSIEKKLNNLSCLDGRSKIKPQHTDMFCWRRPNSNLIEIQTLPIEESPINRVYHGSFRPINSTSLVKEEPSSQPKDNKPKRSSKFSRFESDSDSDSDSNYDFVLTSPSSDSTKEEDDTGSVLEMSQTQQEENSLDQSASHSSDKENEDNESISSLNNCDEVSKVSKCDKTEKTEGEHSSGANRDDAAAEPNSEQSEFDSDRARMEARKRKFESKQCVVLDKSKKISLKKIVGSFKTDSGDRKSNAEEGEEEETTTPTPTPRRNRRKHAEVASESRTAGASSASIAFADTTEDLRVSLKQRREERKNGRRKRKRKEACSPSPSRVSPVIKSVLSIVKMESQKKAKREKRTERSRRNKNRKKSPSPHLNEGKSHQNGKKLPVRLRLGRPVNKKDEESDVDKSTSSSSRKREKNRNATKRSRKELSAGVTDPYPAGDYQFKVNYDLEAKIRRIREQNQAIMRRRDEVAADRKKHT